MSTLIRYPYERDYEPYQGKKMDAVSLTVPDQSLTIRQLLDNHSRGIVSPIKLHERNFFDIEIPKFMDLTDAMEYKRDLEARKMAVESEISDMLDERRKKAIEDARKKKAAQKSPKEPEEEGTDDDVGDVI